MDATPKMASFQVAGTDFPITIPGRILFKFRAGIEENEIILKGRLTFDFGKFRSIMSELAKRVELQTKTFDFR